MSPEQALGRRTPLDGRTDIYSLGVTIYELLTLRPAVLGDDRLEVLRQIAQDEPTPPRKLDPTIPVDLETIVLKAMAKAPADRYATAAELAADLGRFLDDRPILARRPSLADRGAKWMRRHRALVATATAGSMIFVMGLGGAVVQYDAWLRRHNDELEAAVALANSTRSTPTATDGWPIAMTTPPPCAWHLKRSDPGNSSRPKTCLSRSDPARRARTPVTSPGIISGGSRVVNSYACPNAISRSMGSRSHETVERWQRFTKIPRSYCGICPRSSPASPSRQLPMGSGIHV